MQNHMGLLEYLAKQVNPKGNGNALAVTCMTNMGCGDAPSFYPCKWHDARRQFVKKGYCFCCLKGVLRPKHAPTSSYARSVGCQSTQFASACGKRADEVVTKNAPAPSSL